MGEGSNLHPIFKHQVNYQEMKKLTIYQVIGIPAIVAATAYLIVYIVNFGI